MLNLEKMYHKNSEFVFLKSAKMYFKDSEFAFLKSAKMYIKACKLVQNDRS